MRPWTLATPLAVAACLAAPTAAAADSIAYVKGGDVWLANADGSGQHQVTRGGGYGSPSQADDGTIAASHGNDIVRLAQNGAELSRFDPPSATDSAGQVIDGKPVDVAISPDGSKVAFTYYHANCPPGASCGVRTVTMYSHADRLTAPATFGQLFLRKPSWISNDRILAFGGYRHQVNLDGPDGANDNDLHWFDDEDVHSPPTDLGDGELSRQGDRLALIRGYGADTHLQIFVVTGSAASGPPPAAPASACATGKEPTLAGPSWSPDGKAIAFEHSEGVEVLPLPNVVPGDCPGASSGRVVIPGGSQPDWGPAPVAPAPPAATPATTPPAPAPAPAAAPASAPAQAKTLTLKLKLPARVGRRAALRNGISVRVTVPGAGSLTAAVSGAGRQLGSARATARGPGAQTIRVRIARRHASRLRLVRQLTMTVTFAAPGEQRSATATVRLAR